MKEEQVSENRGGRRKGAGRKRIYENPANFSFIVEKDFKEKVLSKYTTKELRELFVNWLENLIK